ncbi:hypothetical protein ACIPWL_31095 [Streptomyces sp. NPDC090023]|uniref:hypothetical protein n=1 Tax=unclassified Streptomyces TaxID=2593676 RepID=UPI00380B546C
MSVRRRLAGSVAVVATAASTVLALLPGTADAAPQSTASNPLSISTTPAERGPLLPGGATKNFTFTVTNHSSASVAMNGELQGAAHGALPLMNGDVKLSMQAVHAPATTAAFGSQDGQLIGAYYPKGGHWGSAFKIPAHASWTWKVSVTATKAFPINDDRLAIVVGASFGEGRAENRRATNFHIGSFSLNNGGPLVTKMTGGTSLTSKKPLALNVSFTNRTGLPLARKVQPWIGQASTSRTALPDVTLAYDLWNGKKWVSIGEYSSTLPVLPAHLADGATVNNKIRVRIVGWNKKVHAGQVQLQVAYDGYYGMVVKNVRTSN